MDNKDTIEHWVHSYGDDLFKWAYHKTSDRLLAEDLVQDTFLSAVNSFDSFKRESNPKTWLLKILNNKIIDYYRKSANSFLSLESIQEQNRFKATESLFDEHDNWQTNGLESRWEDDTHLLDVPEFNQVLKTCLDSLPSGWKSIFLAK